MTIWIDSVDVGKTAKRGDARHKRHIANDNRHTSTVNLFIF